MSDIFHEEAEQALLGALLVKNDIYSKIVDITKPQHFHREGHRVIYNAIVENINQGRTVDSLLLKSIADDPFISALGGKAYIAALCENVISTYSAPDYARTIRDYYVKRRIHEISNEYIDRAHTDKADGLLENIERELFLIREAEVENDILTANDGVKDVLNWISEVRAGKIKPIKTGIYELDKIISGLYPGRLYVVAGRPGMGKTVLALNLAEHASVDKNVLFFSLEMTRGEISRRMISRKTGISVQKQFEAESLSINEIRQIGEAVNNPKLIVDDRAGLTINQIVQAAKRVKKTKGLDVIIIDYLGLIRSDGDAPLVQKIATITVECKRMAKELGCPVLLLSQLNRGVEDRDDKRPQLSDLRDSGAIEQDADVVIMLYRGEYYQNMSKKTYGGKKAAEPVEDLTGKAEIIVAKNRQGETRTAHVGFNGVGQFFYDMGY